MCVVFLAMLKLLELEQYDAMAGLAYGTMEFLQWRSYQIPLKFPDLCQKSKDDGGHLLQLYVSQDSLPSKTRDIIMQLNLMAYSEKIKAI